MIDQLDCAGRVLDLRRAAVMGVLNVTPDSFSDGGVHVGTTKAIDRAAQMLAEGAAIIDVGGESTRPGAAEVSVEAELERVVPVIESLHARLDVPISVDTSKPEVMRAAVAAGAGFINDVQALCRDGALAAASELAVPVCLMHMRGEPRTMQADPRYGDLIGEILGFLSGRIDAARVAGIPRERLVIDPGFGFGKTVAHNLELTARLDAFAGLGCPILYGASRKSTIGSVLDRPVGQRLAGGLALAVLAVERGVRIVRTHDVRATFDAIRMTEAVLHGAAPVPVP
ncbi:MAG: dihydropteroate synthase [Chromatiales bacterium]|nr:dihydropteroate synthase [Chromatiales bacterium]